MSPASRGPWLPDPRHQDFPVHPLHGACTSLFSAPPICWTHCFSPLNQLCPLSAKLSPQKSHITNPLAAFKSLLKCQLLGEAYLHQYFKTTLSLSLCPGAPGPYKQALCLSQQKANLLQNSNTSFFMMFILCPPIPQL